MKIDALDRSLTKHLLHSSDNCTIDIHFLTHLKRAIPTSAVVNYSLAFVLIEKYSESNKEMCAPLKPGAHRRYNIVITINFSLF